MKGNKLMVLCSMLLTPVLLKAQQAPLPGAGLSQEEIAKSNNPLAELNQISFHDFITMHQRGTTEVSNTMNLRGVMVAGRQIIRATVPFTTLPADNKMGYNSGLGDIQIFDAIRFSKNGASTDLAIGPMIVFPTGSNDYLGTGKWQAGGAFVAIHHIPGGHVLGSLVTYQHSFAGQSDREEVSVLAFQPTMTFNIAAGLYARSAGAIWTFDFENQRTLIPFGLGAGKVFKANNMMVNIFVEPQLTVYSEGAGQPAYQVFFGLNLQWAKKAK
ncbi:hypothetical protein AB6805_28685 [Chitinophaga sp. RCC_12]|uniref:hypothetical protein n=1 Tax=Chitinophaga sp. RCC_12 TaxID=3239226 RepID=UPI003525B68B